MEKKHLIPVAKSPDIEILIATLCVSATGNHPRECAIRKIFISAPRAFVSFAQVLRSQSNIKTSNSLSRNIDSPSGPDPSYELINDKGRDDGRNKDSASQWSS